MSLSVKLKFIVCVTATLVNSAVQSALPFAEATASPARAESLI